ncbi:MAG: aldo/keto reductase [Oscillospiraceae bacterium]|nr:aldo/keto reductase [Oscillospiraceae bacterium]
MSYLGENIRPLGFGFMRLPMLGREVDIEQTKQMVDLFMEKGFTYFDTAYGYLGGKSEAAIKTALVDRYPRERFQLATKLPAWFPSVTTREQAENMFWTSLERTGAGYFDFYLLHNLGEGRTEYFDRYDLWNFLAKQKTEGRIKHLGFSIHAGADHLEEVLTAHPEMEFVQMQINYADWESDTVQSRKCYETARRHGKPVIIMEPVKGGSLSSLPPQAEGLLRAANPDASAASWAIRYAASLEGIVTVLSGMSNLAQVEDNLSYMEHFTPLSEQERDTVEEVRKILAGFPQISCTECNYCAPGCPKSIPISDIFRVMNEYLVYHNQASAQTKYTWAVDGVGDAAACLGCGACETVCPQKISISEELSAAAALFHR